MKAEQKRIQSWWGGLVGALLTAALGVVLLLTPLGGGLVNWSYDLLFILRPHLHPPEAVLVLMDDESHARLEQPFNAPWDRRLHARLVQRLTAAGASAIVMDVVFSDPAPDPEEDRLLAAAMKQSGRVILAADTVPGGLGQAQVVMRMVTMPTDALREATASFNLGDWEGVGSAELEPDADFVVRRHFHGGQEDYLTSLGWLTAKFLGTRVALDDEARFQPRWVNYYGPAGTLTNLSYFRALDPGLSPDALLQDKVVYVGARLFTLFTGQRKDEFRTPFSYWSPRDKFMPGVEVQATLLLNLLRRDWLERWPIRWECAGLVVVGLLFGFGLPQLRFWGATGVSTLAIAAIVASAYGVFRHGSTWFPWLLPVLQIGLALLACLVVNSLQLYVQKRLLVQTLSLHVSGARVRQLIGRPELLRPGAEREIISILFSDIANFTTISERMSSDELAALMNRYFEAAISRVHATDGMVVKLIGDAIFAVWNAPLPQAEHQNRACQAALMLRDTVSQFTDSRSGSPLETRVGVHTGVANVGNFGSSSRFDYTAIGESVNLASRMEGLNKHLGTRVLMTRETHDAVTNGLDARFLGHFRLKGFKKAVDVFELRGPAALDEPLPRWRETFAAGLECFRKKNFDHAMNWFRRTLRLQPDDGPSLFYIATLSDMLPDFLPDDWAGEVDIREK